MGGGDIKMMAMVGALMGWKSVLLTTFLGSLSGSLIGIVLILFKGRGRRTKIPFGPFLALGTLITLFFGQEILLWYLY
jgi:leader peptidase (prepilin peptidase)/N-methyltransferase